MTSPFSSSGSPDEPFRIVAGRRNGAVHLRAQGDLDFASAERLQEQLRAAEREAPEWIILDLSGLEFMDSSGLKVIVAADARARDAGRRFSVVRGPEQVQRVLRVTMMDRWLELLESSELP
jgi:anti-sigma B factor antagonist